MSMRSPAAITHIDAAASRLLPGDLRMFAVAWAMGFIFFLVLLG
jgi:hypothetical protein